MNKIFVGKTPITLPRKGGFLYIHDEVPDIPYAKVFDPAQHSFNPLKNIDYRKASDIVDIFDALFARGDSTLTKDTGLDYIAEVLDSNPASFTDFPDFSTKPTTGEVWAHGKLKRIGRSPALNGIFNSNPNFSFDPRHKILARLNRAELGDFDALVLALFLIGHYKGQVIVPDFGFYGREMHTSLIRENRLIAGVRFLDQLPEKLRQEVLLVEEKVVAGAIYDDAVLLAKHVGLLPDPLKKDNDFNQFVEEAIKPIA